MAKPIQKPKVTEQKRAEIVQVTPEDYPRLSAFLLEHHEFSNVKDYWINRFRLWWDQNPSFQSEHMPRGWLLEDQGAIKGFFGVIPRSFQYQKRTCITYNTTTWGCVA